MSSASNELPGALHDLSGRIIELMDSEEIERIEEPYIIRSFRTYPNEDLPGSRIMRSVDERTSREGWNPETYNKIIEEIQEEDIYSECLEGIRRRITDERGEPEDLLSDFIRKVIDLDIESTSDREIMNQISIFIAYLDNSPVVWKGVSWINGMEAKESIRLDEDVTIRPPKEDDLEIEMPLPIAQHRNRTPPTVPSSIIEFNKRTNDAIDIDRERNSILSTLSLYSVATIAEIRWNRHSDTFHRGPRVTQRYDIEREKLDFLPYTHTVEEDSMDKLRDFYSNIRPLVTEQIIERDTDDFLTIAFDRYQGAIADDESDESRLTSAIMCLEALLLGNEGELSDKLSRRAGILLGFFEGYHPIEVTDKTRSAYNIRSRYVHGAKIDDEDDVSALTDEIIDYARRCILTILQVRDNIEKTKLLNKLDESGLHQGPRESLEETIEANCQI